MATLPRLIPISVAKTLVSVLAILAVQPLPALRAQGAEEGKQDTEAPEAAIDWTDEEIADAIRKLDSDDFVEREKTQTLLWKAGERAEAALEEASRNGSAEARFRASRVLERFRLGIYPETPPEIVGLVMLFRRGNMDERTFAISRIAEAGQFEIVRKLIDSVENEEEATTLARTAAREAEEPARALIAEGKLDEAEAILRMSAVTPEAMQNFAVFCELRGDAERVRKEIAESPMAEKTKWETLHWLARAAEDFPLALEFAEKLKDKILIRETKIASGDMVAFAEGAEDLRLRTLKALGFSAAAQRLKGDREGFEKTIRDIVEYAVQHESESLMIYTALMANGAAEEALAVAREANPDLAFSHLLEQGLFKEAMEVKGLDGPRPPFDRWLAKEVKAFEAKDASVDGREALLGLGDFDDVAAFLDLRGEQAYLNRMASELAKAAEKKSTQTNVFLARYFRSRGALDAFSTCIERALAGGEGPEDLLGELFGQQSSLAMQWSEFLVRDDFKADPKARFLQIDALLNPKEGGAMPPEVAEMLAVAAASKLEGAKAAEWHGILSDTWSLWEGWDKAVEHLQAALKAGGDDDLRLRRLGEILLYQREWESAAEIFGKLAASDDTDDLSVYVHGWALARAGKAEEGEAIMRKVNLRLLSDLETRGSIEKFLWESGDVERAERQGRLILAIGRPYDEACAQSCIYLSARLRYTEREDEAAVMMERHMLHALNASSYYSYLRSPVASAGALLSVRARAALRRGGAEEALKLAGRALEISPGDSAVMEYLYPMLVENGQREQADALFEKVYPVSRDGVALYPEYGQANNNHAWLLARCGKHLDEALEHAEKAVALEPRSSASIDTLAEVYFARGEFKKAIETSDLALVHGPGDAQLLEQNQRFHKAAEETK